MIPKFPTKIINGVWTLNRPKVFESYVKGLKDGNYYLELHKVKGTPKTLEQLGYYYAVVVPTAYKQMVEDGNDHIVIKIGNKFKEVPITEEVVDLMLKESCAKFDGKNVILKRDMTKEEASIFLSKSIRWCARYLHCVIPEPDEVT